MRTLFLICGATAAWAFGFGSGSQLVSHWMNDHNASSELIGWSHSCYYFGLAAASLAVPVLNRRFGTRGAALGMLACGPSLALFPWMDSPVGWFALRMINGAFGSLSLIPLEAMVSRDADATTRARDFAFYGVALTLGGALGMGIGLNVYEQHAQLAFYLGSAAPMLGGLALLRWLPCNPRDSVEDTSSTPLRWRRHFLSFGTAWSQGFLEGGMLAFLALYLESRDLTTDLAGDLMGVTTVGVMLFQVPVSWLADRLGRVRVLIGCYAVVIGGLALAPMCPGPATLACCLFVFGACAGAMYPLGLALLGEQLPAASLARTYSWYLAMECLGSLMGPPAMGAAIDLWGGWSMFVVGLASAALVLVAWMIIRHPSSMLAAAQFGDDAAARRKVA
jgi:MFS family permease